MTREKTVARQLRDAAEDLSFGARVLALQAPEVRARRAHDVLQRHWWERLMGLHVVAADVLRRAERLAQEQRRERVSKRRAQWRAEQYQLRLQI
jgi:hypothetical protein